MIYVSVRLNPIVKHPAMLLNFHRFYQPYYDKPFKTISVAQRVGVYKNDLRPIRIRHCYRTLLQIEIDLHS